MGEFRKALLLWHLGRTRQCARLHRAENRRRIDVEWRCTLIFYATLRVHLIEFKFTTSNLVVVEGSD